MEVEARVFPEGYSEIVSRFSIKVDGRIRVLLLAPEREKGAPLADCDLADAPLWYPHALPV